MVSSLTPTITLETAYQHCEKLASSHYENFPVASLLLPKHLRRPIAVIYTFAREADDIADEGNLESSDRLEQLQNYWQTLEAIQNKCFSATRSPNPIFIALHDVLEKNPALPITLLFDLLRAFKQDVTQNRYKNFKEITDYCRYSANPVGRLLLHLTNQATEDNLKKSDAICTGLQLINFLQDIHSDLSNRDRCYLPTEEMNALGITIDGLNNQQARAAIDCLIQTQLTRANQLFEQGAPLGKQLKGLFGFEIRLIIACGFQIMRLLKARKNVYTRPTLRWWHWPTVIFNTFL